jgi:hypothetical protein
MPDQNESLGVDSRATVERVVKEQQPLVRTEDCEMAQVIEKTGAGEGNRTLVISLEGCCSTIELHPRTFTADALINLSQERRSNCLPQGAPGHEQVREIPWLSRSWIP